MINSSQLHRLPALNSVFVQIDIQGSVLNFVLQGGLVQISSLASSSFSVRRFPLALDFGDKSLPWSPLGFLCPILHVHRQYIISCSSLTCSVVHEYVVRPIHAVRSGHFQVCIYFLTRSWILEYRQGPPTTITEKRTMSHGSWHPSQRLTKLRIIPIALCSFRTHSCISITKFWLIHLFVTGRRSRFLMGRYPILLSRFQSLRFWSLGFHSHLSLVIFSSPAPNQAHVI